MADSDFSTDTQPTLQQLADYIVDGLYDVKRLARLETLIGNATSKGATMAQAAAVASAVFLAEVLGQFLQKTEELVEPAVGPMLAKLAGHLIGVDLSSAELRRSAAGGGDTPIGNAVAGLAFNMLSAPAGEVQPGDEGARKLMGIMSQLVFNGWFESTALELITSLFPGEDSLNGFTELPDKLIGALGMGRLARTALRPLAAIRVATPLEWKLNKDHRPTLLTASQIAAAFIRGEYTEDAAREELARLGYSDHRSAVLTSAAYATLSNEDALLLMNRGVLDEGAVLDQLRAKGHSESTGELTIQAAQERRLAAARDDAVPTIRSAYLAGDLNAADLSALLGAVYRDDELTAAHVHAIQLARELTHRHLSESEIRAAVKANIVPMSYYRNWMADEQIPEAESLIKELLLRTEIEHIDNIEAARKQAIEERAKEKAARELAAQQRAADAAAKIALERRGAVADLRRAVVTGLIPIERLGEVLTPKYDSDTVAILLEQTRQDRAAYVAQQQAAADAKLRAENQHVPIGTLQAAVYEGVIPPDQFARALDNYPLAPADKSLLVAVTQARAAALAAAAQQRAAAEAAAKVKHIDLARFELLVRRGHRTLEEYRALLQSLGFDEASQAAMVDLLSIHIADDTAAREQRQAIAAARDVKSLTFEQARRAVLLGLTPIDSFANYLAAEHYTAEAQGVLLEELRADLAIADAARAKRATADAQRAATALPIATLAHAAALGVITPAAYEHTLRASGYSDDDVAIELELLATAIAEAQAKRAAADAAKAAAADKGLSLDQLARAVQLGDATIEEYQARAGALGYTADAIATLTAVLEDQVSTADAAAARRTAIDGELAARSLSIGELEAAVKAGALSLEQYRAQLETWGYDPADAALLTNLLALKLAGAGSPPA